MSAARSLHLTDTHPLRVELEAPPLVRAGVTTMLRAYPSRLRVLPPESTEAPDVALVDLLSVSAHRTRPWAHLPVVALVPDDPTSRAAAELMGATRVLPASAPTDRLVRTIEEAHAVSHVGGGVDVRTDGHPEVSLSPREAEILTLISQGLTNEQITGELYLSLNTVKSHIRSAYRKIGVTTRAQAVIWCFTHGDRRPAATRIDARSSLS
jgi:DNA-binding NarL/FixJ family response regulator